MTEETWDSLGKYRPLAALSVFGFLATCFAWAIHANFQNAALDRQASVNEISQILNAMKTHQDYVASQQDRNTDRIISGLDKLWAGMARMADAAKGPIVIPAPTSPAPPEPIKKP